MQMFLVPYIVFLVALMQFKGVEFSRTSFTANERLNIAIFFYGLAIILGLVVIIFKDVDEEKNVKYYIRNISGLLCQALLFLGLAYFTAYFMQVVNNSFYYGVSFVLMGLCGAGQWYIFRKKKSPYG